MAADWPAPHTAPAAEVVVSEPLSQITWVADQDRMAEPPTRMVLPPREAAAHALQEATSVPSATLSAPTSADAPVALVVLHPPPREVAAHAPQEAASVPTTSMSAATSDTAATVSVLHSGLSGSVATNTLQTYRWLLVATPRLQGGKRAQLVFVLISGAMLTWGAVELFVRCVLDRTLPLEEDLQADGARSVGREAAPNVPQPQWSFTGSGVTSGLSDLAFGDFQCLLTCLVCVVTGLGSEFFVGYEFLTSAKEITDWHEHAWFVAQFLFSVMVMLSIQLARSGNPLSLALLVPGMWKFGFPETLLYVLGGLHVEGLHWTLRLASFLNGLGALTHHSASVLFVSLFTLGLSPFTRPCLEGILPLVLQHLVVAVKYYSLPLFAVLELLLEVYFEVQVCSTLEYFYLPHGVPLGGSVRSPMYTSLLVRCTCAMVLAHWCYWAAALIDAIGRLLHPLCSRGKEADDAGPDCECSPEAASIWQGRQVAEWRGRFAGYHAGLPAVTRDRAPPASLGGV